MTDSEKLDLILSKIGTMQQDIEALKHTNHRIDDIEERVSNLEFDMRAVKNILNKFI